jgi:signal recognition particle subunit SEC65
MGRKNAVRIKQVGPKPGALGPGAGDGLGPLANPMEGLMAPPMEELAKLKLPDRPSDRGYKVFWPLHQTLTMDTSGFQCIYPNYLDSTKSVGRGGRRLPLHLSVPNPTVSDISSALQLLSVRHVLQPYRGYSRDPTSLWDNPGRVLADTKTRYASKLELLKAVAAKIPTLSTRIERIKWKEQEQLELEKERDEYLQSQQQQQQQQQQQLTTSSATAGGGTAASSKKKKGAGKQPHSAGKHRK